MLDTTIPWPVKRSRGFTGPYVKPKTTTSHQEDIPASDSRNTAPLTTNETEKSALTNVSFSQVAKTTHGSHPRAAETHDRDSLTDTSPSQPDAKKCIQVGRATYAVTSHPGTSYASQDYDSILVMDSSNPIAPKRKSTKQRKPNRHNNRHNKTNSFSGGSKL